MLSIYGYNPTDVEKHTVSKGQIHTIITVIAAITGINGSFSIHMLHSIKFNLTTQECFL